MKAISIWQPWSSAIALGLKTIETRGWATPYRGPLAIHAAKRWGREQKEFLARERANGRLLGDIPLGAIVAVARLAEIQRTVGLVGVATPIERLYGDYSPGRYGWILADVRALKTPIQFRGAQGLFDVPDRLIEMGGGVTPMEHTGD